MRLAVLADIHGNLPALEAVRAVQALDACVIRGNREDYVLAYHRLHAPDHWHTSRQWVGLRWLHECLDQEALDYIASLPEEAVYAAEGTAPIRIVHASPGSMTEPILPSLDPDAMAVHRQAGLLGLRRRKIGIHEALALFKEPVLLCAHSHISWKQELEGRLIMNPGSVGIPINGDTRAQYAVLTWQGGRWQVEQRAIDYDRDQIRAAYQESGILDIEGAFALAQLRAIETGQNVPRWLLSHCRSQATQAGVAESEAIPDEIWAQASATFDWHAAALG